MDQFCSIKHLMATKRQAKNVIFALGQLDELNTNKFELLIIFISKIYHRPIIVKVLWSYTNMFLVFVGNIYFGVP